MDIWISVQNSQMANNLVKWWKTKFLNGYKQFSVECRDGKVSDTEELLGRSGSEEDTNERLRTACTTPPLQSHEATAVTSNSKPGDDVPSRDTPEDHLSFEEFSCDVSVENGEGKQGQDRQEFSFTLYDFDGHGKITKDDIAGLVTTIYEALGSSVKVPRYGSKTIKVKLTVSPEQRRQVNATIINQDKSEAKSQEPCIRYKRDLNVTIRQDGEKRRHCKRSRRKNAKKHQCCKPNQEQEQEEELCVSDDSSDACSSDDDEVPKNLKKYASRYTIPNIFIKDGNMYKKAAKKRSGSLQRQELLEIIQANMDKNNLGFQTSRKHSKHVSGEDNKQQVDQKHQQAKTPSKAAPSPLQYLANMVDPTHFYVDLASLQNTTQLPQTQCQYDKLINAVMCVSNKKIHSKCRKHRAKTEAPQAANDEELKPKRACKKNVDASKNPHVVTGHTSSPHYMRHKNRQEDQARAMAQVVRWLEQEFSNNLHTRTKTKSSRKDKAAPSSSNSGVERHEHHHVHEHIHHHYHHYQDVPLVV